MGIATLWKNCESENTFKSQIHSESDEAARIKLLCSYGKNIVFTLTFVLPSLY